MLFWSHLDDWGYWVGGVITGLGMLGLVGKWIRGLVRWALKMSREIDALHDLAQYELRPNHGGSLKDHAAQVPPLVAKVETLTAEVAAQGHTLTEHMSAATSEQTSMWQAIEAIAKSSPPEGV
jgi:hypothetical protein